MFIFFFLKKRFWHSPFNKKKKSSAKTGLNVHEVFHEIVRQVRKDIEKKGITPQKTEAPSDAYMAKLMKKFERWTLGLHLKEKMKSAKDQIKKVGNYLVNRNKDKDEKDKENSGIGSPTPSTPQQSHTSSSPVNVPSNQSSSQSDYSSNSLGSSSNTGLSKTPTQEQSTPPLNNNNGNSVVSPVSYGKIPKLDQPQQPSFYHYPWFHAHMSGPEADAILSTSPPGTFLIRPSSQPGNLAGKNNFFLKNKNFF